MSAANPPAEATSKSAATPTLQLTRWTVTSGSNVRSRGAVANGWLASIRSSWSLTSSADGGMTTV